MVDSDGLLVFEEGLMDNLEQKVRAALVRQSLIEHTAIMGLPVYRAAVRKFLDAYTAWLKYLFPEMSQADRIKLFETEIKPKLIACYTNGGEARTQFMPQIELSFYSRAEYYSWVREALDANPDLSSGIKDVLNCAATKLEPLLLRNEELVKKIAQKAYSLGPRRAVTRRAIYATIREVYPRPEDYEKVELQRLGLSIDLVHRIANIDSPYAADQRDLNAARFLAYLLRINRDIGSQTEAIILRRRMDRIYPDRHAN